MRVGQFDLVRIRTTRNVSYYSSPTGQTPHGEWTVIVAVGQTLLLHKADAVVRIPAGDVELLAVHDPAAALGAIKRVRNGI